MSHLYFNEVSDYSDKNTSENEAFRSTRGRNCSYSRLSCRFIIYNTRMGNLDWRKCHKQPLEMFCKKKVFFKILQNSQETPVNFAKFSKASFLQNNSGRLLLKCEHCKSEVRKIDCFCSRELDTIIIASAKIPESKESISPSSFYEHLFGY